MIYRLFRRLARLTLFRWQWMPFLPLRVDVEPIDTCNFACDHCQVTHWDRPTTRLTKNRFQAILRQFSSHAPIPSHWRRLKLQGMGEPLLNKELLDMLEETERHGIAVEIITNGSVYTERIASCLLSLRRARIVFSVDGASAETFEAIRVNGNFQRVIANLEALLRRRGDNPWPSIEVRTVATSRNVHELPDLVRLAKRLGVDKLTITIQLTDWGKAEMQNLIAPINLSGGGGANRFIQEALKTAAELDLSLELEQGHYSPANPCRQPWTNPYIAANGDVVPCCVIADSGVAKMGNVFDESFARIWNNAKYRELRRRIRSNDVPSYCRTCYGMSASGAGMEKKLQ